jgi:ribosomal protein S8
MKNRIYITKYKRFILALLFSIGFISGIPLLIYGFINHLYLIGVLGIVFTVAGFYGTPILWIAYSSLFFKITLFEQITLDKIFSIKTLAETNNRNEKEIINNVNYLIVKRYLTNYIIEDNKYIIDIKDIKDSNIEMYAENKDIQAVKCKGCGAVVNINRGYGKCPYCGLFIKNEDKEKN